jgi:hypothetical protein
LEPEAKRHVKQTLITDWMLDYLGDEHKAQVLRLNRELADRLEMRGPNLDPAQLEQMVKDRDDAVRRLLTPEEALQYDLRQTTGTAGRVLQKLDCMEATEPEFVTLYTIRQAIERQHPDLFRRLPDGQSAGPHRRPAARTARGGPTGGAADPGADPGRRWGRPVTPITNSDRSRPISRHIASPDRRNSAGRKPGSFTRPANRPRRRPPPWATIRP